MGLIFVLCTISLKKWFDNRAKNEKLLGRIQSLAERIHTIENDNLNLTGKIQSMSMGYEILQNGTERLSEGIHTVEIDNRNLLKSYDKLSDRTSLQEGNQHAIQIIAKDEEISLMEKFKNLESHVQNENQKLIDLMKSLEIFTGQEIQALQKVVKSFESLEELVRTDNQGDEV